jgi:4'-phosphopantetheinyl transferase
MSIVMHPENEPETGFGCTWQPVRVRAAQPGRPEAGMHLWRAFFPAWGPAAARLAQHLSVEERERMRRFRDPELAARYAIGRGLLRELLGKYLGAAPAEVRISVNEHGKPELAGGGAKTLHFNLAHTDEAVLYGFTGLSPIGVDVESIAPGPPDPLEARRILSDEEWETWQGLPEEEQTPLFYQTWARKESVLKALGVGLSIEPDTFTVGFAPQTVVIRVGQAKIGIRDLSLNASARAAVALTGGNMPQMRCFTAASA